MLSVWEERKVRLYGEHANVHQSHSQNDSGDLRGVAGGDGELGCLCGKAGTSHLCAGSAHSSGCVVNGYGCRLSIIIVFDLEGYMSPHYNVLPEAVCCCLLVNHVVYKHVTMTSLLWLRIPTHPRHFNF